MITREFNLYLHAGHSIPLVINVNQYDHGEQWLFTLFNADGTQYVPSSGAIVGIKSDNLGIINSGTVDSQGRVVINETQQMTAAVGKAVFELLIDDQTHGTANFIVLVEPKPGDNADLSESDLSLIQQAIDGTSAAAIAEGVADWMDENLTPTTPVVDQSLTVQGAAADSAKVGQEISDLKSQITQLESIPYAVKQAMDNIFAHVLINDYDSSSDYATFHAWATDKRVVSISAIFDQGSEVIYDNASLDSLKPYLTVTATYSDSTTNEVTTYSLNGTLAEGTSTITVLYGGKTATFSVLVTHKETHNLPSEYQEVEWVANSKKSLGVVINGFKLPSAFRLEAKTQLQGWNTDATYGNIAAVFQPGVTTYGYELAYKKEDSTIVSFLGAQSVVTPPDVNAELVVGTVCNGTTEQAYMVVNGERVYGSSESASRNYRDSNMGIFYGGNSTLNQFVGKLWYLSVYDSSENLIAEIVPCYRKSDTKIGLYDTVSNSFHYQVGSADAKLTKGADV